MRPKLINLTPHMVTIKTEHGEVHVLPSGQSARCAEERQLVASLSGVPVSRARYGEVQGLPEPQPGVAYIVSALVLGAVGDQRADVFAPGPGIRDTEGRIVACDGLSCGSAFARAQAQKPAVPEGWRVVQPEEIEMRSTNGRWAFSYRIEDGVLELERDDLPFRVCRAQAVRVTDMAWRIVAGDDLIVVGGDLDVARGGELLAHVSLQSHRYASLVQAAEGSVIIDYGYKRRSRKVYEVRGGIPVLLTGVSAAEKLSVVSAERQAQR